MDNKCLVFATNNNHKLEEINSILNGHFTILSLKDINCFDEIEETSNTLEGNAAIKARYINSKYHYNCFADDTGLEVFTLNNEPGVYSARYAYKDKNDSEANIDKLLHKLENKSDRRAQFRTAIALIIDEKEYFFEGIIKGTIAHKRAGINGFGYDSIFIPEGYDKTFAQLGSDVKNNISHRARAIQKLTSFLTEK